MDGAILVRVSSGPQHDYSSKVLRGSSLCFATFRQAGYSSRIALLFADSWRRECRLALHVDSLVSFKTGGFYSDATCAVVGLRDTDRLCAGGDDQSGTEQPFTRCRRWHTGQVSYRSCHVIER